MSQDAQPHHSLLSLSIAAANAAPIPASLVSESVARSSQGVTTKHRRLSSAGRSRRRLTDARDAAIRPFPTSLQTASASLAALSLSSPTVSHRPVHDTQPIQVPRSTSAKSASESEHASVDDNHFSTSPPSHTFNGVKSVRKRGTIFTCESCSKVYRHPSCLIKHRWEHTPQWREASKFVLSKHQQVQLLEAAAILSHLSPSSASLPEDRSLWPSFLSGGLVPPPAPVLDDVIEPTPTTTTATSPTAPAPDFHTQFPISSSVPASAALSSCLGSTGPRLHDYAIGGSRISVTQVRPGIFGVPIAPMSVPTQQTTSTRDDDALNLLALRSTNVTSGSRGSPTLASVEAPLSSPPTRSRWHGHSHSLSYSHSHSLSVSRVSNERERRRSNAYEYDFASGFRFGHDHRSGSTAYTHMPNSSGGWSLPRSSIRSKSGSSGSRSRSQSVSESRSDDEVEAGFGDTDLKDGTDATSAREAGTYGARVHAWKTEDVDDAVTAVDMRGDEEAVEDEEDVNRGREQMWDGMEMEMEMD